MIFFYVSRHSSFILFLFFSHSLSVAGAVLHCQFVPWTEDKNTCVLPMRVLSEFCCIAVVFVVNLSCGPRCFLGYLDFMFFFCYAVFILQQNTKLSEVCWVFFFLYFSNARGHYKPLNLFTHIQPKIYAMYVDLRCNDVLNDVYVCLCKIM